MATLARMAALGRQSTSFVLTPQSVSNTGVFSDATISGISSFSIIGVIKTCKRHQSNTMDEISPSSVRARNNVITDSGTSYDITGFCLANDTIAAPTNVVDSVVNSADYCKLVAAYKGNTETFYGVVNNFETGVESKGQIPFSLTLDPVDISAPNPAFA